ncbi:type I glyceraldehyde-3-phosphate dehydrogenase [Helicobacter cynogastricus]|uniref:type I glyceraldehyde-3-phosphate dehydrogenase n=1 Tax=Helicobacter cynogastricus TaxID=329937 RepID=UPI000CF0747D|nr:type I glyceraldehyde-3-phosphate dehydrogenase [Helicobacter cynogastricus]
MRVAINGTGRIGLCAARIVTQHEDMELVAINSTCDLDALIHLLRYDSLHKYSERVEKVNEEGLCMGNSLFVRVLHERDPAKLNFGNAQVVLECTGQFNDYDLAKVHLKNAVQKVIISAPATNTPTFVYGVNHMNYAGESVISNASCTTNALAPLLMVLDQHFGIEHALMTTIHSYTNDQNLLDSKHKDLRRARAAALNIIPTSTGVNKALAHILPRLAPKIKGLALRVPTPVVSLIDLSVHAHQEMSLEGIHASMQLASHTSLQGILGIDAHQRVSSDFIDSPYSAVYIEDQTLVLDKHHAKVLAWYDNEMGYSRRLIDMAYHTIKGSTC